jgi:hypothetical protein
LARQFNVDGKVIPNLSAAVKHRHKASTRRKTRPRSLDAGIRGKTEEMKGGEKGQGTAATQRQRTPQKIGYFLRWHVLGFFNVHQRAHALFNKCACFGVESV